MGLRNGTPLRLGCALRLKGAAFCESVEGEAESKQCNNAAGSFRYFFSVNFRNLFEIVPMKKKSSTK